LINNLNYFCSNVIGQLTVNMNIHKNKASFPVLKITIYAVCIILFGFNSYAIFTDFLANPTILSTKVSQSPGGQLDLPTILLCDDSTFNDENQETSYFENNNGTLMLEDVLPAAFVLTGAGQDLSKVDNYSIKENFREIITAFHGSCFMGPEKINVSN